MHFKNIVSRLTDYLPGVLINICSTLFLQPYTRQHLKIMIFTNNKPQNKLNGFTKKYEDASAPSYDELKPIIICYSLSMRNTRYSLSTVYPYHI
jgi:hypothetical protein